MACQKPKKNAAAGITLGCICHIMSRGIPIDRGIFHCAQKMKLSWPSQVINGTVVDFLHAKLPGPQQNLNNLRKKFTQVDFFPIETHFSGTATFSPSPCCSQSAFCKSLQNSLFFSSKQHHLALAGGAERSEVRKTRCI